MDDTMSVILLLTGFCVPAAFFSEVYHFVREEMNWFDAQDYCMSEHTELAQIFNSENMTRLMNTPTRGYTDKAWIGLYENSTKWFWMDEEVAIYSNWGTGLPDNSDANEFCAIIDDNGIWNDVNCLEKRPFVCFNSDGDGDGDGDDDDDDDDDNDSDNDDGARYHLEENAMTWQEAKSFCEDQNSVLASIPDGRTNTQIKTQLSIGKEAWIGLSRPELWYWSFTKGRYTFINWQPGQPDNLNGSENCAAVVVKDGTWTDEQCEEVYPFFCYGVNRSWKTVVRMKIQSSANMEDPALSADLQEQLHAEFANQGVTDIKLTWRKLPEKQTQETDVKDACLPCERNSQKDAPRH